jgi:hypothetical protein
MRSAGWPKRSRITASSSWALGMKARPRIGAARAAASSAGARVAGGWCSACTGFWGALAHAVDGLGREVGGDDQLAGHEAGGDAFVIAFHVAALVGFGDDGQLHLGAEAGAGVGEGARRG